MKKRVVKKKEHTFNEFVITDAANITCLLPIKDSFYEKGLWITYRLKV